MALSSCRFCFSSAMFQFDISSLPALADSRLSSGVFVFALGGILPLARQSKVVSYNTPDAPSRSRLFGLHPCVLLSDHHTHAARQSSSTQGCW
mmetsp:Transcript_23500/g.76536  ORF Transcript_23500/g.76536 Transcript_23500/m.76536 type:complete len:93 (-) Transcript_23500:309-587(-)